MRYAGIDEATPELALHAAQPDIDRRPGWLRELSSRIALVAALGTAAVTVVLWLARTGHKRLERTRAGGLLNIVRCPEHGIAYDVELEECTECAKAVPPGARRLSAVPSPTPSPSWPGPRPLPKTVQ